MKNQSYEYFQFMANLESDEDPELSNRCETLSGQSLHGENDKTGIGDHSYGRGNFKYTLPCS